MLIAQEMISNLPAIQTVVICVRGPEERWAQII